MIFTVLFFFLVFLSSELCQPLESALDIWTTIFQSETLPSIREPKETCRSIGVTASLFRLMGKVTAQDVLRFANISHSRSTFCHLVTTFKHSLAL